MLGDIKCSHCKVVKDYDEFLKHTRRISYDVDAWYDGTEGEGVGHMMYIKKMKTCHTCRHRAFQRRQTQIEGEERHADREIVRGEADRDSGAYN